MNRSKFKINLYRYWKSNESIIGIVDIPGISPLFSLELPWKNNEQCISCIPIGNYKCFRRHSSKNRDWNEAFEIMQVPSRTDILFGHIGNEPKDILGCVAFGRYYFKENYISHSKEAIDIWMNYMKGIDHFQLSIYER